MPAADGTYRIFKRPASNDPGVGFTDSGESHTGTIGDAFGFAQSLQDADSDNVYIPLVGYDVLRDGDSPNPAVTSSDLTPAVVDNRVSAVWEQLSVVYDWLVSNAGEGTWALQSYGPG